MTKGGVLVAGLALVLGAGGGYWYATELPFGHLGEPTAAPGERKPLFYRNAMNPAVTSPVPAKDEMGMDYVPVYAEEPKAERKPLFYRNPMNPEITSPVPAKDEMGMDYVPVFADNDQGSSEPAGTVTIDPTVVQNIGVRTARAERQAIAHTVRAVGRVAYDEERLARLHPKTEGWIEKLFIDKTGEPVKQGTILLDIYSPQLVTSQQEYLLALKSVNTLKRSPYPDISQGARDLARSSRERLELLDVPAHQIRELEKTGRIQKSLHIHSPFNGIVMNVGAREGEYVTPQTELYMLADLSQIWVFVDVYEYELPWIKVGDTAEMRLAALPGRTLTGRIDYVYPYMESQTRTIKLRLRFENPDLALKPDMYADVTIQGDEQQDAVVVPAEAIVRSGNREQIFVEREPGKFEPREVKLGISAEGKVAVLQGVEPGEVVVTSSQFLIDSESKLREATAKMLEAAGGEQPQGAPSNADEAADSGGSGQSPAGPESAPSND